MSLKQLGGKHNHLSILLAVVLLLCLFVSVVPVIDAAVCSDKCGNSYTKSSTTTQYQKVQVCSQVRICAPVTTCKQVTTCIYVIGKRVCTTNTVCTTKTVCATQRVCTNVLMKRDCTTTTTYKDCTRMIPCGRTGCAASGTYTNMISQRTSCGSWKVA